MDNTQTNPTYDHMIKPRLSATYQNSVKVEEYAVSSFKPANGIYENHQQQKPLKEYAEIDMTKKDSPQQYNPTDGYDEINENKSRDNSDSEVPVSVQIPPVGLIIFAMPKPAVMESM